MSKPQLKSMMPHTEKEAKLTWSDQSSHILTFEKLRFECPCAVCVDELTGKRVLTKDQIIEGIKPKDVRAVGQYAIQILWNDGHSTGIYPYDLLHEICVQKA